MVKYFNLENLLCRRTIPIRLADSQFKLYLSYALPNYILYSHVVAGIAKALVFIWGGHNIVKFLQCDIKSRNCSQTLTISPGCRGRQHIFLRLRNIAIFYINRYFYYHTNYYHFYLFIFFLRNTTTPTIYMLRSIRATPRCSGCGVERNVNVFQEIKARVNGEKGVRRFELALFWTMTSKYNCLISRTIVVGSW